MPQTNRINDLLAILRALADAVEKRFGGDQQAHPTPTDTDVDHALAHAGDVARRLRIDPASLVRGPEERAEGGPEQPAKR